MKNKFTIVTLIFLLTIFSVCAANLNVQPDKVVIESQKGVTTTSSFTIYNLDTLNPVTLSTSSFTFDSTEFVDSDGNAAIVSFTAPGTITASGSASVTAKAIVNSKMNEGSYSANVLVQNGEFNDTFTLEVIVNPDVCDSGKQPSTPNLAFSDWELKKNPETDEKDEYYPGDKVVVQSIKVENNGDDEITDIVVEAKLYDLSTGDEIESITSDSFNLKSDKDSSVDDLEFSVPSDVDETDDYAIFMKVYEDGSEDDNCNFESIPVTIKKRSRDMQVDLTSINPQNAKCGDAVDFSINVKNIGSKDDSSVFVKIQDPALKITGQTAIFSLDSDDETTKTVRINLPIDLVSGVYSIESAVIYSGTTARSDFGNLTVTCEPENRAPVANAGGPQTVESGNIVTLNGASSSDPDNNQLTYLWTQVGGMAVQLSSPTSAQTTFTPNVADTYTFKLDVTDGKLTNSATTSVVVQAAATSGTDSTTYQPTGVMDLLLKNNSLQQVAWGLAILVLLLIAVYLIKLIFFPPKKKMQMPMHNVPTPQPEFPE
ncbi:MAG: putative S-layer protein [Candidatus Nanoarchaeia archaeon]|nr:putative S-layer protein [Candidatus Nanoarchaeia archaeon]